MAQMMTINLNKGESPNLGFRLQGGVDFAAPIVIQKVNGGSPAERAGLQAGDAVIKINSTDIYNLRHKDAQDVIIKAGPSFAITVQRGGSTWKPSVTPTGSLLQGSPSPVTKTSLAAKPQASIGAIGTGHNVAAKPFLNGTANGGPKLVNKQYNSPIGLYSEQSIAETLSAQSEVLSTGVLGVNFKKNEKNYDATKSAVYHMLQEAENEPRSETEHVDSGLTPAVSNFGLRHVTAPENKPTPPTPQLPPGQNICADCERLIVGVFVRIKDKNLHVECFKCSTCGCSLKNVGYYNINNKLYCDVHAKLAAKSNPPGPNLVPVTLPPGGRAPAGTISAALSTHPLPSPAPLSPKIGPASPSTNITAAPFLAGYTNAPRPFTSVAAPLSPNSYLPRTPVAPPPSIPSPKSAPASAPDQVRLVYNIVWPPVSDEPELPTACPVYYPPPSQIKLPQRDIISCERETQITNGYCGNEEVCSKQIELIQSTKESKHQTESCDNSVCISDQIDRDYTELEDYTNTLAAMEHQKMSVCSSEVCSLTGRRSMIECAGTLSDALETQMLVDSIIKKRPKSPPPLNVDPPKIENKSEQRRSSLHQGNVNNQDVCPSKDVKSVCPHLCDKSCCNQNCPTCPLREPADLKFPRDYQKAEELKKKIQNAVPHKYETPMTAALKTTPANPVCMSPDIFSYIPSKHSTSALASALSIAPSEPFHPVQSVAQSMEPVPLPEETVPYFPPEHPIFPVEPPPKPVKKEFEKPDSPFVEALKVAPDRPFTPIGKGPTPIRKKPPPDPLLKDLPKPQQRMSMLEALTTTPDRTYSPLIPDIVMPVKREEEIKARVEPKKVIKLPQPQPFISTMVNTFEGQPNQIQESALVKGDGSSEQELMLHELGLRQEIAKREQSREQMYQKQDMRQERHQMEEYKMEHARKEEAYQKYEQQVQQKHEKHVTIAEREKQQIARQSEEVVMKKPMQLTSSLHKSEYLPSYQTSLQYEEEIQLPHHKNINKLLNPKKSKIVPEPGPLLRPQPHHGNITPPPQQNIRPVQIVQSENPHNPHNPYNPNPHNPHNPNPNPNPHPSSSFQVINDDFRSPSSSVPQRLGTPSASMINKPPSAIPYYQQNLVATQYLAPEVNVFDPKSPATSRSPSPAPGGHGGRERSPSPFRPPSRAKSPAPGPPPNPLKRDEVKQAPQFQHEFQREKAKDSVCGYIPQHKERFEGIMRKEGDHYDEQRGVSQAQCGVSQVQSTSQMVNQQCAQQQMYSQQQMGQQMYNQQQQAQQQIYNQQQQAQQFAQQQAQQHAQQQAQQHAQQQAQQHAQQQAQQNAQQQAQQHAQQRAQQQVQQQAQQQMYSQQKQAQQQMYNQQQQAQQQMNQQYRQQSANQQQYGQQQQTNQPMQYVSQSSVVQQTQMQPQYHDQRMRLEETESRSQISGQNFQQQNYEASKFRAQETQKHQTSQSGNMSISVSEQAKQEQLQKLNKSQMQSVETSPDSRVQIQRKKTVTEEFERSHKEKTIEIEKSTKHPFQKVNVPEIEEPGLIGLHVTNPHPLNSPFLRHQPQAPPPLPSEQKIEKRTVAPCTSQAQPAKAVESIQAPHPPSKFSAPVPPIVAPPCGQNVKPSVPVPSVGSGSGRQASSVFAPKRGRGVLNVGGMVGNRIPLCGSCHQQIRGPFITALGKIWCPDHFVCNTPSCKRPLQDIGFVEEQGNLHCEYCFERYLAPDCSKCNSKIKGDCLKAIGKNFHPECFNCAYCGKLFGNSPFFLEDGLPYCETDWNEMFTTKCFACGFPVEAGDRWVEALNNNYHSQCFNCTMCKKNLEGQSFFAKGGRPFCKNHAR